MSLRADEVQLYLGGRQLLCGVSGELRPGELITLIGPNGAGKSTLVRCLSGILPPSLGTVTLNGCSIGKIAGKQRAKELAYLPQQLEAPFAFTLAELLSLNGVGFDRAHPALALLELYPLLDKPLNRLSGGERQRAAIARALLSDSPFVILDEPLAHLDPKHVLHLLEYLAALAQKGKGILAVMHDLRLARRFGTHCWLLSEGKLLFDGAVSALSGSLLEKTFGITEKDLLTFS